MKSGYRIRCCCWWKCGGVGETLEYRTCCGGGGGGVGVRNAYSSPDDLVVIGRAKSMSGIHVEVDGGKGFCQCGMWVERGLLYGSAAVHVVSKDWVKAGSMGGSAGAYEIVLEDGIGLNALLSLLLFEKGYDVLEGEFSLLV